MVTPIKTGLLKLLGAAGYQLRRTDERVSLVGALQHAAQTGYAPATIIDVGAAYGDFARTSAAVFPDAGFVLIEPLEEFAPNLEELCQTLPSAEFLRVAAGAEAGLRDINVHPDLVGSSFHLEAEDSDVNGVPRPVPVDTVDAMIGNASAPPPYLIKVDVQGAELDVLDGAASILGRTDMVILEVSFFRFFEGAPQFHEVVAYMNARGFVAYDVFGLAHRPLDGALAQADVVFVPEGSSFRTHHHYAMRAQREASIRRLQAKPY